ncbi:MAG TPA: pH regulation protein F [Gammaproteobacteria bacterium]|nr:pH regulation protein F [Gammaproteobacteria bacterium]HAK51984.1 pH regulation protein F [Gammaproteobacteria bacterium]
MFAVATVAILIVMAMMLVRAFIGPTFTDRILAVNSVGTATVLFVALLGFLTNRPEFLDISLLYALINFVGTLAILKFFNFGNLGASGDEQ